MLLDRIGSSSCVSLHRHKDTPYPNQHNVRIIATTIKDSIYEYKKSILYLKFPPLAAF